jgi:hypothetical protein
MNEPATDVKAPPGAPPPHYFLTRPRIFGYDLIVLVVLMLLGFWYIRWPDYFSWLSPSFKLAVESMWFGSLGGVIISLKGIYDHSGGSEAWDPSFNLWHLGRPVSGAIAGLMTVVLLMAVSSGKDSALSTPVVYASAFIFGTQERRFFNFLYEVARLIVQVPEDPKSAFTVTDVQPSEGSSGSVIVITGKGIEPAATAKLGTVAIDKLVVSSDGTSAAGIIPSPAPAAGTVDVTITNSAGKGSTLADKFKFTG